MKKIIIMAIAIVAVSALVGCNRKVQQQTAVMPSQDFVGTWSNNNDDDDYLEIHEINAEENRILFVWFNHKASARRKEGTAKIEDGKIKFVIQDWGEGTSVEATGTLVFDENGITLAVEESNHPMINAGATYQYPVKASGGETEADGGGDISLPPVIDLYQYSEERLLLIDDLIKPLPENLLLALIEKRYEEDFGVDYFSRTIWPPDLITIIGGNTVLIWNTYSLLPHAYGPVEVDSDIISQYLTDKGKEIMKRLAAAAPQTEKPAADGETEADGGGDLSLPPVVNLYQ